MRDAVEDADDAEARQRRVDLGVRSPARDQRLLLPRVYLQHWGAQCLVL
jgi:hypothetical protein